MLAKTRSGAVVKNKFASLTQRDDMDRDTHVPPSAIKRQREKSFTSTPTLNVKKPAKRGLRPISIVTSTRGDKRRGAVGSPTCAIDPSDY